jgi:hypothetical protein
MNLTRRAGDAVECGNKRLSLARRALAGPGGADPIAPGVASSNSIWCRSASPLALSPACCGLRARTKKAFPLHGPRRGIVAGLGVDSTRGDMIH